MRSRFAPSAIGSIHPRRRRSTVSNRTRDSRNTRACDSEIRRPSCGREWRCAISQAHASDATIVRSFAYATGPAYGLLLDRYAPGWRAQLENGRGLDVMLGRALGVKREEQPRTAGARAARYDAATLHAAEVERDSKRQQQLAINRRKFVDGPVLTLVFRHMNVQFNPQNLQPLGDAGTVYPTVRVTNDWGVIEGTNGALMKPTGARSSCRRRRRQPGARSRGMDGRSSSSRGGRSFRMRDPAIILSRHPHEPRHTFWTNDSRRVGDTDVQARRSSSAAIRRLRSRR